MPLENLANSPQNALGVANQPTLTPEQQNDVNVINNALNSGRGGYGAIPDPTTAFNEMAKTNNAKFINPGLIGDISALAFEGAGSDVHRHGHSVGHTWNTQAINNALKDIFNPTLTPDETKVFTDTANQATSALNSKQAPKQLSVNKNAIANASSSALGGNVKTPQMLQQSLNKMNEYNQQALNLFGQQVATGRNLISQLNNPLTQQEFALKYMNNTLQNVLQYTGKLGMNHNDILNSLTNMYQSNNEFNNLMNQYFTTMLGLQYNLPSDINQAFDKQNAVAQQMISEIV